MQEEEFDAVWRSLQAMWPQRFDRDDDGEQRLIWRGFFIQHDYQRTRAAVKDWIGSHRQPPTVAELRVGIRLNVVEQHALRASSEGCGDCDRGWIYLGTGRDPEVKRCPNCRPPLTGVTSTPTRPERHDVANAHVHAARIRETLAEQRSA